ncbi:MAG TPA: hypothetical protein PL066_01955 [bacterium]|nr:hypothetical protein [bacterium]
MKNLRHYLAWTLLSTMFLGGCLNTQVPTGTPPQVIVPSTDTQQEELMESDEILEYMVEVDETNLEIDRLINEYEEIQQ